ncbi:MAG: indolepyruvate oxidoreductase subunit beta [Chloroflexota bacterium]|nr:indolepyruvate oxidoreductase subunit beta [Chloroflexota bacterium]
MKKIDLLLSGIGGQGVILASNILAEVAMDFKYDVKKSDVLGMAQRGGAVVSHVRLADRVRSPLVQKGNVDVLLSFERLEAGRWVEHLSREGYAIINNQSVFPLSVSSGYEAYPLQEEMEQLFKTATKRVYFVDALSMAQDMGNRNVVNIIMLGFLSFLLPIDADTWESGIAARVPPIFRELNLDAFRRGRSEAEKMVGETNG